MQNQEQLDPGEGHYQIDIEGTIHLWDEPTITAEQLAELGGWPFSEGVILIDRDNVEHQMTAGGVYTIEPDVSVSRKIHFRRG